jgi:pimeloyl-ACP methyl ester carboxylesterase
MYYVEAGAGSPVLLIMGFGGDHTAWAFQMATLSARHRVIAFDNRGAGQTEAPDHPYTTRMMAGDALGLMDALEIARAHVIGVSMGGMIAQELALASPERVCSLHLGCTLARPDAYMLALNATWRDLRIGLGREATLRTLGLWLFAPTTYTEQPELVETVLLNALSNPYPQSLTGFLRQGEAIASHDAWDRLAAIRCPTLVSVAEEDILVPARFSREIAARIPGAELRTIPAAGHGYFMEQPAAFNALSLDFIARSARAAPSRNARERIGDRRGSGGGI